MDKNEKNNDVDIEVVMGDNTNLNFSEVADCVTTLRPKDKEILKKKVIIPKNKNEKNK
ncbi:MAG: hypothetical protein HFJ45_05780 [Clostridia bacterium]|nr:hypothetical protein [Clostridia bacterium]